MKRRVQMNLTDDALAAVESLVKAANENFKNGKVNYSDAINEMIICSKVDIPALQAKNINLRKSLRHLAAQDEIDVDQIIKTLSELKIKTSRRTKTASIKSEVSVDGKNKV